MRPRFSLRTLLVLTAVAAIVLTVLVTLPTLHARRFARAINNRDFATAARIQHIAENSGTALWNQGNYELVATLKEWSLADLFSGRRRVTVYLKADESGRTRTVAGFVYGFTPFGMMQ
jgi:hypothetical protein